MRALKFTIAIMALSLLGCGIYEISISITPRATTVIANDQAQFQASVGSAGNKTVLWYASRGIVTETGLFTAPETAGVCYVMAVSQADESKEAVATVTVEVPVAVSPSTLKLIPGGTQAFTAIVTSTGDTNVIWSIREGAAGGLITSTGDYTAPATNGTYRVVATSVADPTKYGIVFVTVDSAI